MAILMQNAVFLLQEHKHRPIVGDVLTMGRQTVTLTYHEAISLLHDHGVAMRYGHVHELDTSTVTSAQLGWISDRCFFSMFTDATVKAMDVSEYEKADYIHDLNQPLPLGLHGIADFIFNGSVLDDLFNPGQAIRSMSEMLRPRGRIMHCEAGAQLGTGNAYVAYSPAWFHDFYAVNRYVNCDVWVCAVTDLAGPWSVYKWSRGEAFRPDGRFFVNMVVADKGEHSDSGKMPVRSSYNVLHGGDKHFIPSARKYDFRALSLPPPLPPPPRHSHTGIVAFVARALGLRIDNWSVRLAVKLPPPRLPENMAPAGSIDCFFNGKSWVEQRGPARLRGVA